MMLMMIQTRDTTRYRFSCNQVQRTELHNLTQTLFSQNIVVRHSLLLSILSSDILSFSVYCCQTFPPPQYIGAKDRLRTPQAVAADTITESARYHFAPNFWNKKDKIICRWTWIEPTRSEYHHNHIQPFWDPLVCWWLLCKVNPF